ncbi:MAG: hypothetical protein TH68_01060 [Candidatus Synechococcus spongiarum 142]|uniref:EBNA-1 nuclear protein n=1 Tax=Candidatus Synechococcus spongiarum 142 TaxID=1608213 RepID=A0A6N3X6Q7_9SYNE|nr:MAG: hypothetical protein TH68_01060 [Candidatus Synechococcus spongiarum 142]
MLSASAPLVLLQHGGLQSLLGKTGLAMLRYRRGPIVAVIDPDNAGAELVELTGIPRPVPVVANLAEALPMGPTVAAIGLAPSGGQIPAVMRQDVEAALAAGLSLANGLHTPMADDPQLRALLHPNRWIWDLRREPHTLRVGAARAARSLARRLLFVGTDMAVGKMSAALELHRAGVDQGLSMNFVATGQAGILISGGGVALDAVRVDYAAGAVEAAVLEASTDADWVLVEGQGSLLHPGSTATLPLLRGSQPTDLVLVHRAGQDHLLSLAPDGPSIPIPPLPQVVKLYETVAAVACPALSPPCRLRAIALNTSHLPPEEARAAIIATRAETGLFCDDPVRFGGAGLLAQLQKPSPMKEPVARL